MAQAKRSHLYFGNYPIQDSRNPGLGVPALKSNLLPPSMVGTTYPRAVQEPTWDALHRVYTPTTPPTHTQQALVIMLGLTGNRHNCPAPLDV